METLEQEKNVILPVRSRHLKKQVETLTNENEALLRNIKMIRLKNHQLQGKCDELQGKCDCLNEKLNRDKPCGSYYDVNKRTYDKNIIGPIIDY